MHLGCAGALQTRWASPTRVHGGVSGLASNGLQSPPMIFVHSNVLVVCLVSVFLFGVCRIDGTPGGWWFGARGKKKRVVVGGADSATTGMAVGVGEVGLEEAADVYGSSGLEV